MISCFFYDELFSVYHAKSILFLETVKHYKCRTEVDKNRQVETSSLLKMWECVSCSQIHQWILII